MYHNQAQPVSDLSGRDDAACERRSRAARESLREEIGRPDQPDDAGSERTIALYLGLLEGMNSSALDEAADKAQRGSNQALQAACRLALAARREGRTRKEPA